MKIRILKIFAVILAPVCLLGTYLTYNYRYRRAITYNSLNVIKDVRSQGYFPTAEVRITARCYACACTSVFDRIYSK